MGQRIRLLIVDDHDVIRQALRQLLAVDPEVEVVGEAGDGESALTQARKLLPDVVLMDIRMPGMDGIAATQIILRELPHLCVIGLTMFDDPEKIQAMLQAGAKFLVRKELADINTTLQAIRNCLPNSAETPVRSECP